MAIPQLRVKYLDVFKKEPQVLTRVVEDQLLDLRGYKTDQIEAAIQQIQLVFSTGEKISVSMLEIYRRQFEKMRIAFPEEVERRVREAEDFSK